MYHSTKEKKSTIYYGGINMLLSVISSSAVSMSTSPGLPQYGALVIFGLIALLSIKEVLSASKIWSNCLNNSFNMAILPLLLAFGGTVCYKILECI